MRFSEFEDADPNITPGKVIKWSLISLVVIAVVVLGVTLYRATVIIPMLVGISSLISLPSALSFTFVNRIPPI